MCGGDRLDGTGILVEVDLDERAMVLCGELLDQVALPTWRAPVTRRSREAQLCFQAMSSLYALRSSTVPPYLIFAVYRVVYAKVAPLFTQLPAKAASLWVKKPQKMLLGLSARCLAEPTRRKARNGLADAKGSKEIHSTIKPEDLESRDESAR